MGNESAKSKEEEKEEKKEIADDLKQNVTELEDVHKNITELEDVHKMSMKAMEEEDRRSKMMREEIDRRFTQNEADLKAQLEMAQERAKKQSDQIEQQFKQSEEEIKAEKELLLTKQKHREENNRKILEELKEKEIERAKMEKQLADIKKKQLQTAQKLRIENEETTKFGNILTHRENHSSSFPLIIIIIGIAILFLYKFFTVEDIEEDIEEDETEEPELIKWSKYSNCNNEEELIYTEWHYLDNCYITDGGGSKKFTYENNSIFSTTYENNTCSGEGVKDSVGISIGDCSDAELYIERVEESDIPTKYDVVTRHWENTSELEDNDNLSGILEERTDPVWKTYEFNTCYNNGSTSYKYVACSGNNSATRVDYPVNNCPVGYTGTETSYGAEYYKENDRWHSMKCNSKEEFIDVKDIKMT